MRRCLPSYPSLSSIADYSWRKLIFRLSAVHLTQKSFSFARPNDVSGLVLPQVERVNDKANVENTTNAE